MVLPRKWTKEETRFLEDNLDTLTNKELAAALGRTVRSVHDKIRHAGFKRDCGVLLRIRSKAIRDGMRDQRGDKNPNWKGGISENHYHYKCLQKQRYPERVRAREKVSKAVLSGKLVRGLCMVCGSSDAHAHHEDYSKPLDVLWFCRACHREIHGGKH